MSINAALNLFLDEYANAKKEEFANNILGEFIRHDVPEIFKEVLDKNERYLVQGSVGQGNWAKVPWVAIFDRLITETARDGYYVVYLVKEDFSGLYLSLNQGITVVRNQYGADAKEALQIRATDFLARIGSIPTGYISGSIDLSVDNKSGLGAYYEQGSICAKYYEKNKIPSDEILTNDLKELMSLYLSLATKELLINAVNHNEEDEINLQEEALTQLREHKRIERNRKLAEKAKKHHGYICQACYFNFEEAYGSIGRNFIEAHHKTPLYKLKGQKIFLNPKTDFAVLCSNCHRMIHRSEFISDVDKFREKYILHA